MIAENREQESRPPQHTLVRDLQKSLSAAVGFIVSPGPACATYPSDVDEEDLLTVDDHATTAEVVGALSDVELVEGRVVQALATVDLTFLGADGEWMLTLGLMPGWIRRSGWPGDGRLPAEAALWHVLADAGVERGWIDRSGAPGADRPGDPPVDPEAAARQALWRQRWPGIRPIGYELRTTTSRWVRFHSLPDSQRYAADEGEYAEILRRHHTILGDLTTLVRTPDRRDAELLVITSSWSSIEQPFPRSALLEQAAPGATYWQSLLTDDDPDGPVWTHLFVQRISPAGQGLDLLLRMVADYAVANIILTDNNFSWLYHPYDGGGDVIVATRTLRDGLKEKHADWLSSLKSGL